ncbi:MAG TPA: ArsR family transcriptional regulator [Solirubrobacterales bacterium]|nr:ArsR family transcriptional regulator [Solirubrobacterales bacterium]
MKAIVRHDGRLDVLCCLVDGAPLAVPQLSAMTGMPASAVSHYIDLLRSFDLVTEVGSVDVEESLYSTTLEGQPDWVRMAIETHRRRD